MFSLNEQTNKIKRRIGKYTDIKNALDKII